MFHFGRIIRDYPPSPAEGLTLKHLFQPFQTFNRRAPFKSLKAAESPTRIGVTPIKAALGPHRHPAGEQCCGHCDKVRGRHRTSVTAWARSCNHTFVAMVDPINFSVVVTVCPPAHALHHGLLFQHLDIGRTRVLSPLIGMMDQSGLRTPLPQRHVQSIQDQLLIDSLIAQPTTRREYKSKSTARYSHPLPVAIKVCCSGVLGR